MPEAGPDSPGHVGHTPQHVDVALRAARHEGMLSAGVPRRMPTGATLLASQTFPQPQRFRQRSLTSVLLAIDGLVRRTGHTTGRQPWPQEFREAVASTRPPE